MTHKRWYLTALLGLLIVAGLVIGISSCSAWAQRERPPVLDAAGVSETTTAALPVRAQFDLLRERYLRFNDDVAETQQGIYGGEWISVGSPNGAMPMGGLPFRGKLEGEGTDKNSYYLARFWRLDDFVADEAMLRDVVTRWDEQGWETVMFDSDIYPGNFRAAGTASDGTWIAIDILDDGINLTAYSGLYWADTMALRGAVWNIQQNERNEGTRWLPAKVNANGDGLMAPGDYAPFPEWNEIALAPELEDSRQ